MKNLLVLSLTLALFSIAQAQESIGINNNNPDASALLDIASTTQGVLVPRMTNGERDLISNPAQGLLIYSTSTNTFWFRNNSNWIEIVSSVSTDGIADADGDTRVEVEQTADDDFIRFTMRGTEYFRMDEGRLEVLNNGNSVFLGQFAGRLDNRSNNRNVFVGASSGQFNTDGQENVGLGYRSLFSNTVGEENIAFGFNALRYNTTGNYNLAIGSNALTAAVDQDSNIAVGYNALLKFTGGSNNVGVGTSVMSNKISGNDNVVLGAGGLQNNITGSRNIAVGKDAGQNNTGSNNVFLGYSAGKNETGSNKLYIEPTGSQTPLIYGDFAVDSVVINGDLRVTGNILYSGTLTSVSDRRLKENFDTLKQVMHFVNQLQAYSYTMKGDDEKRRDYGLMAQEVQKVFPEMVTVIDPEKGYIGVNYLQLVAVLIEGLKEQQELIATYESRQGISSEKLNTLKAEVEQIKSTLNLK